MLFDLIIVGGGPAGITAGIYAARKKMKILIIVRDFVGNVGKISEIENWPGFEKISGMELMQKLIKHLRNFEIEILEGDEAKSVKKIGEEFEIQTKDAKKFTSRTVIIASGRSAVKLGVPGEAEFAGKGVSSCSTCEAPFFRDKIVGVVGGGNSGFRTALDLIAYAKKVYIFDATEKIRADEVFQEKARESGKIEIIFNAKVEKINGNDLVNELVYRDMISNEIKTLQIDGVFVEIGSMPATEFVNDLVDFNEAREIIIEQKTCKTKTPGLFAAGDVSDVQYKQLIVASGEGTKAALSAYNYLQEKK